MNEFALGAFVALAGASLFNLFLCLVFYGTTVEIGGTSVGIRTFLTTFWLFLAVMTYIGVILQ